MTTATRLLTAKEFADLPETGADLELVRGEIIEMNLPSPRHGQVCARIIQIVGHFAETHALGHLVSNDAGIITERDPDTVRGGDVWFVGYNKIPPGPLPTGYLRVAPDIVFEVKSPSARWNHLLHKIAEYLDIGVQVVCVLDPEEDLVRMYYADRSEEILSGEDAVTFPQQLPEFLVPARRFFA
jgi:Uma2 family endonuclease